MQLRTPLATVAVLALASMPLLAPIAAYAIPGTPTPGPRAAVASTQLSLSQLTERVEQQVLSAYPNAYLVEVDGVAPGGPTTDIADVTSWTYRFNDVKDSERTFHASVAASLDGIIGAPQIKDGVWAGSTTLHPPVTMEPATADHLLKAAGYTGPYTYVTLRQPNAGGFMPHPLYIFDQITPAGRGYVGVDTVAGDVAFIS